MGEEETTRKNFILMSGTAVKLEGLLKDHEAELVVNSRGHYNFICFCNAQTSGSLRDVNPLDPYIQCGNVLKHEYTLDVKRVLDDFHKSKSPLVYAFKKEERTE